jgi:hypothetical protein
MVLLMVTSVAERHDRATPGWPARTRRADDGQSVDAAEPRLRGAYEPAFPVAPSTDPRPRALPWWWDQLSPHRGTKVKVCVPSMAIDPGFERRMMEPNSLGADRRGGEL